MRYSFADTILRFSGLPMGIAVLAAWVPVVCQEAQPSVSFSVTQTSLTVGEPVILRFVIENTTAEPLLADLGFDRKRGFKVSVRMQNGELVDAELPQRGGIGRIGKITVQPGQGYSQNLVLNEWYRFSSAGQYEIQVMLTAPMRSESGKNFELSSPSVFSIRIEDRDTSRLEKTCSELVERVLKSSSVEEARDAAFALSYVNDPLVVPHLEKVLKSGQLLELVAISGLERIGNEEAVRVLIAAVDSKSDHVSLAARSSLMKLALTTKDAALKESIEKAIGPVVVYTDPPLEKLSLLHFQWQSGVVQFMPLAACF